MKRLFLVLPILALVIAAGCGLVFDTPAEESYTDDFAAADYWRINLNNEAGDVIITTATTDFITVSYTKRCKGTNQNDAEEHLNDIDILLEGTASTGEVTITADFPNVDITREYEVVFTITMPDSTELNIVNTSGDINCQIDNLPSTGYINLEATTGEQTLVITAMDTTAASNIIINATTGSVNMTLPPYAQLDFDMEVTTGEVRINDYAVTQGTPYSNKHKVGTTGDYEVKSNLDVITSAGDITLSAGD
jgi:hypothetical protein